jgi:hypothetical protein
LAGGLGLPFANALTAVIEQFFPELEINKELENKVRDAADALLGENNDYGEIVSDMALRGIPYGMGVDLSSRMSLSNLMGVSPYDGLSLENLAGPTGSVIGNMFRAVRDTTKGDFGSAAKNLVPRSMKNTLDLYLGGGDIRDRRGRKVLEETNTAEKVLYGLGLRPTRLVKAKNAARLIDRHEDVVTAQNTRFHEQMAEKFLAGDIDSVRAALLERESEMGGQGYNSVQGARSVVDKALNRLIPFDPAREGPRMAAGERHALARRAGLQGTPESERVQTKKSLEAALGVPGAMRTYNHEMATAQLVDQLMSSDPMLSKQEAYQMAQMMMMSRRPQRRLLPPMQPQF